MRKLRNIVLAMFLVCFLVGCGGKNEENPAEPTKGVEETTPAPTNTVAPTNTPTPTSEPATPEYPVSRSNLTDIYGLWYSEDSDWMLILDTNAVNDFPNIAEGTLTDGNVNYACFLDEKGRKSEGTFEGCGMDESLNGIEIKFTEDGILVDAISDIGMKETLFVRPSMYQEEAVGTEEDAYYYEGGGFYVERQLESATSTYFVLSEYDEEDLWIMIMEGTGYEDYEGQVFLPDETLFYPNASVKGIPLCVMNNIDVCTLEDFEYYYYLDEDDYAAMEPTPECNFPGDYDAAYYDEETGLWVVSFTTMNRQPFKVTGYDFLEWEGKDFYFVGKIQNTGKKPYTATVTVRFCNKYGETLDYAVGYVVEYEKGYSIDYLREGKLVGDFGFKWDPGEEAYIAFLSEKNGFISQHELSYIDEQICYIYIEINGYSDWTQEKEDELQSVLQQLENY